MGIKINTIISYTFVIGSLLAGIGSILYFTDRMTVYILTAAPFPASDASLPRLSAVSAQFRALSWEDSYSGMAETK